MKASIIVYIKNQLNHAKLESKTSPKELLRQNNMFKKLRFNIRNLEHLPFQATSKRAKNLLKTLLKSLPETIPEKLLF